ncbi:ATP-binding protein [Chitinophaga horti]|uniref:histidine kinase n=1 Tax=Chitinophaga horti TaxID=2920382 RepID=A0ABY6J578_9BACT|nr:ATP-binding protein [Chitinophaga horti]UYQ94830.1 ATP-binding protein [Chitinophaga horti]
MTERTKPRKFTILLVDDRIENLLSLEEMLDADHRVFMKATSGNDALKQVLKNDDIGLIMLDVQMPEMDGFEVARLLKANPKTRDIAIIFVTAINKDEQHVLKGFEEGAVDYLPKPLDLLVTRAKVNVFEKLYFYERDLKMALKEKELVNNQLERFMYVVAHDLQSPLSGSMGLMMLMQEDPRIKEHEDLLEYTNMAVKASYSLSEMITAIFEFSRKNELQQTIEDVDVTELVNEIVTMLFPPSHIKIHIEDTLPVLSTVRSKLHQVFQNLIGNAIKYNDKPQGEIFVGVKETDAFYEFYVKDNGPGIEEKNNERIFKLFEVVDKENAESTGIGLNILKYLVESQGGKVWVESFPGEGSCFWFQWRK